MFKRILIANRGEIALRVIRTAREMGIECVTVFSEFDREALHTRMGHQAIPLGGNLPSESYLVAEKILAAAKQSGAEAIHPGYGFLSENADFARAVVEAGMVWIGPPPRAIEVMGDKIRSRQAMVEAGVPLVPGKNEASADALEAASAAAEIGLPVALKAAAGGGGKGIRVVREQSEVESAFRTASGEAQSAFGDGRMYVEKYIDNPRHIEIQVLFDQHGNCIHLGERECSIQRRHQKLLEETPACVLDPALREEMGEVALRAGRAVDYEGVGTVEFLFSKGQFFFLEMNTRLQVEHPITEMVTGVDLVREQLLAAAGETLSLAQKDIEMRGHAIEVRINAEDVPAGFLPATGTIKNLRLPAGPWVRVDSCMYRGLEVGLNYDPMLGKVIVWGPDRKSAMARMQRALEELNVGGVRTSATAAMAVLKEEAFLAGEYDTHFLESLDLSSPAGPEEDLAAALAAVHRFHRARRRSMGPSSADRNGWLARSREITSDYQRRSGRHGGQI
ncbi:MAG: acetyl-CoA carboxylase biotin carboxylase subunit [Candidatus Paceibacteria bacterium]|jgi:acetyl-CoA carboxylase biotin carboxylase subunit